MARDDLLEPLGILENLLRFDTLLKHRLFLGDLKADFTMIEFCLKETLTIFYESTQDRCLTSVARSLNGHGWLPRWQLLNIGKIHCTIYSLIDA